MSHVCEWCHGDGKYKHGRDLLDCEDCGGKGTVPGVRVEGDAILGRLEIARTCAAKHQACVFSVSPDAWRALLLECGSLGVYVNSTTGTIVSHDGLLFQRGRFDAQPLHPAYTSDGRVACLVDWSW